MREFWSKFPDVYKAITDAAVPLASVAPAMVEWIASLRVQYNVVFFAGPACADWHWLEYAAYAGTLKADHDYVYDVLGYRCLCTSTLGKGAPAAAEEKKHYVTHRWEQTAHTHRALEDARHEWYIAYNRWPKLFGVSPK